MTIAKNTNRAKNAIANAKDIRCFSLSTCFDGHLSTISTQSLAEELNIRHSKLSVSESGRYTLHVHSNLWYEFGS